MSSQKKSHNNNNHKNKNNKNNNNKNNIKSKSNMKDINDMNDRNNNDNDPKDKSENKSNVKDNTKKEYNNEKKSKFRDSKKLFMGIGASAALFLLIGIVVFAKFLASPEVQVLKALQNFSKETVKQEGYIFYDLDINKLMDQYLCADVSYKGKASVNNMKDFPLPLNLSFEGGRSYEQQQMKLTCTPTVVLVSFQKINVFANNDNCYLHAPKLGIDHKLPVTVNLFPEKKESGEGSGSSWFTDNKDNIIDLVKNSPIKVTGKTITASNGEQAEEYLITIKRGNGLFIWKRLGIEAPDHDEYISLYITNNSRIARIEVDFSDVVDGSKITLDGLDAGTLIIEGEIPDQGKSVITLARKKSDSNTIHLNAYLESDVVDDYLVDGDFSWKFREDSFVLSIKELEIQTNGELTATINYDGTIEPEDNLPDLFEGFPEDPSIFQDSTWEDVFDDVLSSFM